MDRERIDGEERAGHRGERRREPVHVVEQVERVRHPEQPHDSEQSRGHVVGDDLDADTGDEDERDGRSLRGELRERGKPEDVVDHAGDEEDGAAAEDAAELAACGDDAGRGGDSGCDEHPGEDAAAAQQGRRAGMPTVRAWRGDDVARGRRSPERPDREHARGQRSEGRGGDCHGRRLFKGC